MIDNIFKLRFIEEVTKITKERDKVSKRKSRFFTLISYFFGIGSLFGAVNVAFDVIFGYKKLHIVYISEFIILGGFAATFLLTFVIFLLAYLKIDRMRSCFKDLTFKADKEDVNPDDEVNVTLSFRLLKRELKSVRLKLECHKERLVKVLDVESLRSSVPYGDERPLGENLEPGRDEYRFSAAFTIPRDALSSRPELSIGNDKITWSLSVDFEFLNWHSYSETIQLTVI